MTLKKDGYEYNDDILHATALTKKTGNVKNLSIHTRKDVDYFKFTLSGTGTAANFFNASFVNASGNLNMRLYDASGELIRSSISRSADSEKILLNGLAAGSYYIKVYGHQGDSNNYRLSWNITNYAPKIDKYDAAKANDSIGAATTLTPYKSTIKSLSIHSAADDDYYAFSLTNLGMAKNFIQIAFTNSRGNLDLNLYSESGKLLASSASLTAGKERISLQGFGPGNYYARVYGANDDALNTYTLSFDRTNYGPKADSHELGGGNNTTGTATMLTARKSNFRSRTIHSISDKDYYKITLDGVGMVKNFVKIAFTNSRGNLDLRLVNASGDVLRSSTGTGNSEQFNLKGLAAGDYYALIDGRNGEQNTYTLSWDRTNYQPKADSYESGSGNNTLETATTLTPVRGSALGRTIHNAADVDFYKFRLTATGMANNYIKAAFPHATGNLAMELYDASGTKLATSNGTGDVEQISLKALTAGDYYAKIYGVADELNTYTLSWDGTNYVPKADSFETEDGDNSRETATALTAYRSSLKGRTIHSTDDVDYFKLILLNEGMVKNTVTASFTNGANSLGMVLQDADGKDLRSATALTASSSQLNFKNLSDGVYYVKVYALGGNLNSYSLSWDMTKYTPKADSYEAGDGNNSADTATRLAANKGTVKSRSIHTRGDVDYYRIGLSNTGTAKNTVKLAFTHATGNLDMKLYDKDGEEVGSSTSTGNSEIISLAGLAASDYYLKVYGELNTYSLSWDRTNYGPRIDSYEGDYNNDTRGRATELTPVKGSARSRTIHNGDDVDVYKFVLPYAGMLKNYVKIAFTNKNGNLDMTLHNASGDELRSSTTRGNSETIDFKGLAAGTYYARVYGVDEAINTYTLSWDRNNYSPKTDSYEGDKRNDTIATATTLSAFSGTVKSRSVDSKVDVDYYAFTLSAAGMSTNYIKIAFTNKYGNLDMDLYNSAGKLVRSSTSTTANSEKIDFKGLAKGTYYARVYGELNTYTLSWNRRNYAPKIDYYDRKKVNDSIATASALPFRAGGHRGATNIHTPSDVDYFKIVLTGAGTGANYFQINFSNAKGNLDMTLHDASDKVLRSSVSTSANSEKISFKGLEVGTYYIKVFGELNTYNIKWDAYVRLQSLTDRAYLYVTTPDRYESNGSLASATTLITRKGDVDTLSIHSGSDVDYYKFTLTSDGTYRNYLKAFFTHNSGNLDMELQDGSGNVLRSATSLTNNEKISLNGLAAGDYYLKVFGADDALNTYSLAWNTQSPDAVEPKFADAALLSASGSSVGSTTLSTGKDVKLYAFTLSKTGTAANHITVNSANNLQVSLLDSAGRTIASYENDSRSRFNLSGLDGGNYYLKVRAEDMVKSTTSTYSLKYDIASSSTGELVVGPEHSSLFPVNDAGTEFAYLMGYGNVTRDTFTEFKRYGARMAAVNPLFYDADKHSNWSNAYMCWAASASNMIAWSGWGEKGLASAAGPSGEDVIFSKFSAAFPNKGGIMQDGIGWFFSKNYKYYGNSKTAKAGTGNYLKMSALPFMTLNQINSTDSMHRMANALQNNMAVCMTICTYASKTSRSSIGAHAVTCWGYTFDSTKAADAPGYYTGMFITDSNDMTSKPYSAPDRMVLIPLSWHKQSGRYFTSYNIGGPTTRLETFVTLDHITNWDGDKTTVTDYTATSKALLVADGNDLDAVLAGALPSAADTMRASASALTHNDDKYKQNGMLTA